MGSTAYQNPTITINGNLPSVMDSYNNVWSHGEIEEHQIMEWLSPLASQERHRAVSENRLDGVGYRLLRTNEFEKWHKSEDQAVHPVLFCYGDPGVGKTYLSSLVIDTLCDSIDGDNVAVACVYCDFLAHGEQSATSVLAVLLKQLITGIGSMPQEIMEAFERAKREVDARALRLLEIRAMLAQSLSCLRRGFICIDGLDELPTQYRPELWDSLQYVTRECPNTRIFITGRPHIQEEVRKYFPGYPDLTPIKPTNEDVREYIIMRLQKDPELDAMDTELEADILRIIPDKISGVFLLASLIMDAVLEDATIHQRRQTLHKMTNSFGLDDAYSATLTRIREQGGSRVKLGMEALMWISHSERPLKAEELCHALAVQVGTTDLNFHNVPSIGTVLSCTSGLVTVDEQASTVRLVHFTLQEYLAAHSDLFMTPHSIMAEICLTYLNFRSVCELPTALDTIPLTTPFLHYASCYWGSHASKRMTEGVKHLALQLLQRDAHHISTNIFLRELTFRSLCVRGGLDNRHPDFQGFTGLHCIAYLGITEIAVDMVNMERWDLNGRDWNGATPLIWAIKYGNYGFVKLLLEQEDIDPTLSDNRGLTPLAYAVRAGQEEAVKLLLERGDVYPNSPDKGGRTPPSYAARSGHEGAVKILLDRVDAIPGSLGRYGRTPLPCAGRPGHEDVLEIFLKHGGVNPDSSNSGSQNLSYAPMKGSDGVVRLLLHSRAPNCGSSGDSDRVPTSTIDRNASHKEVTHPLAATEPITLRAINGALLDAPISSPLLYGPHLSPPVPLKQSPPHQLHLSLAPSVSVPPPGSSSAFPLSLRALILFIFLSFALVICHVYGHPLELFRAIG